MGFENRDYYRDGSYTDRVAGWGVEFTPVVKYLVIVNVIVFLLQIFITRQVVPELPANFQEELQRQQAEIAKNRAAGKDGEDAALREKENAMRKAREAMEKLMRGMPGMRVSTVQEWLELTPTKTIQEGQLWRLVTAAFCHDRFAVWHILFNMLMLYWFGVRLERMYGSREFLLFYLAAAICSSLAYVSLAFYTESDIPAIGTSGAVMGVMMLYVIYYPFETFLLFWVIPVPLWAILAVYVIFDLHPVLLQLAGDTLYSGVAHAGHLGGLAFGFIYWKFGLHLEAVFSLFEQGRIKRPSPRPRRQLPPIAEVIPLPERDDLAERVDAVLKKISEQGQESLTDEERAILVQASTQYRAKK